MAARIRYYLTVALLSVLLGAILPTAAQELAQETINALDQYAAAQMETWNIPGLALAVVQGDQITYLQGYGAADATGRPVTPQTPFLLASLSKSFTATAIMQLVESGQIDLDAPVSQYIAWFREGMNDPAPITVRHLLHHLSGFSRYSGHEVFANGDVSDTALERNVRRLSSAPLMSPPGAAFQYSNSNYDILGYLVQVISGQSYEAYIEERIFAPLEMHSSYAVFADASDITGTFYPFFGRLIPYDIPHSRTSVPSAGLISSAEDLTHYLIAQLNEGRYGDVSILTAESIAAMHQPHTETIANESGYAMGWGTSPYWDAERADVRPTWIGHDGAWVGFRTFISFVPEERTGIVVLMNTNDFAHETAFGGVANGLLLTAMELAPPPITIYEDDFTQNARLIGSILIAVWVLRLISAVLTLRHWRRAPASRPRSAFGIARTVALPLLFDALLILYVLVGVPAQYESPLGTVIRFTPDIGLLLMLALALALGWGLLRTGLFLTSLRQTT